MARFEWGPQRLEKLLPSDFEFIYGQDGDDEITLSRSDFIDKGVQIASDLWVFPFLMDTENGAQ